MGTEEFITVYSFKVESTPTTLIYLHTWWCILRLYYQYLPVSVSKRKREADSTMNTALFNSTWKNSHIIVNSVRKIPKFKIVLWPTIGIIKHRNDIYTSNLYSSNLLTATLDHTNDLMDSIELTNHGYALIQQEQTTE